MMRLAIIFGLGLVVAGPACAAAKPPVADPVVRYVVKPGDTLIALADRYMQRRGDYISVQQSNHVRDPHRIAPNSILLIPVRLLRTTPLTARVLSFRGNVTLASPAATIATGAELAEGTLLTTGPNTFVTLAAADGSRLTVPSQSALRLSRMRRIVLTGTIDQEFSVERGRAETTVMPQRDPAGGFRIRTPIAVSAVRGTEFRIGFEDGPSRTEVLGGTVAVAANGAAPADIPKGVGAGVAADGKVATEKLLPPPVMVAPGALQMEPVVAFTLTPVPKAVRYRLQLARDAGFGEIFDEAMSDTPTISFTNVPNGTHFARATAISAKDFEGLPAVYSFTRRLNGLSGSAARDDEGHFRFTWLGSGEGAMRYRFQLMRDSAGAVPFVDMPALTRTEATVTDLPPGTYFWRVGVVQFGGGDSSDSWPIENWTAPAKLVVAAP